LTYPPQLHHQEGRKFVNQVPRWMRLLLAIVSGSIYLAALPSLEKALGYGATAFSLLPVILTAILFGVWGGLISGILAAILNTVVLYQMDETTLAYLMTQGGIAGSLVTIVGGSLTGWLRDLILKNESLYSRQNQNKVILERRDATLKAISSAATTLLQAPEWEEQIPGFIQALGNAGSLDQIQLYQKQIPPIGKPQYVRINNWISPTSQCIVDHLNAERFSRWELVLSQGDILVGPVENLPQGERDLLRLQGIQSILVLPIMVGSNFWGFIEYDDCSHERVWSALEIESLRIASDLIGSALFRQQTELLEKEQRALAEALSDTAAALNSTLEFEEVLNRILTNVGRVLPHTAANIMLIEEDGRARIVRGLGYQELGIEDEVLNLTIGYTQFPNLARMVQDGLPRVVVDTETDPTWVFDPKMAWVRSYIAAPIRIKGKTAGFINLDSSQPGFYTSTHVERLKAFANQAATALENARLLEETRQISITDELTGLLNWRGLHQVGQQQVNHARQHNLPLSAILLDIDHFKSINDTYDHDLGDQVLQVLAERLRQNTRPTDILGRRGGDEFVILLVNTSLEEARQVAEQLRLAVVNIPFLVDAGLIVDATISLGVSTLTSSTQDIQTLMKLADHAMYAAKQAGRNQVAT